MRPRSPVGSVVSTLRRAACLKPSPSPSGDAASPGPDAGVASAATLPKTHPARQLYRAPAPVAHYYGREAIAARVGITRATLDTYLQRHGFLAYKRKVGHTWMWYSNEALITAWEIARCRVQARRSTDERQARQAAKADGSTARRNGQAPASLEPTPEADGQAETPSTSTQACKNTGVLGNRA